MTEGVNNPGANNELSRTPWTEREAAKMREFLGIPEIVSLEPVSVPHSSLYGIKIKLGPGSNAGPRQIFGPLFDQATHGNRINQVYPRCCFISFDGVDPDKKLTRGELFSPKQQHHFLQAPHQDSKSFVALYHPPLTESKTIPRMAPTMLTDAYNYELFYYQRFRDKLEQLAQGFSEDVAKKLKELRNSIEQSTNPTAEQLEEFYHNLIDEPVPDNEHKKFLEQNAYAHNWQPNQLLIYNESLIFHNAGWVPEDPQSLRNLKKEQGLIRFGKPF